MKNGSTVAAFEKAFADYIGARYAIALCNGTATLHTALVALGVKPGDRVAVPPLTMSATTIAVLQAGAVPDFIDVSPYDWTAASLSGPCISVSLYGLNTGLSPKWQNIVDDAAQTLRKHSGVVFTSYSFQASKILALGEGGMLATDDEELATRAREFSSLGYRMKADQPRIDPAVLKHPTYERHHTTMSWNYRMNDVTANRGKNMMVLGYAEHNLSVRAECAALYREAIAGCAWITPQHVPDGWTHDYWCYAVALESKELWEPFTQSIVRHGGEMPYGAWRLTYQEPAFRHLAEDGCCPVAEDLQPRLVQFQTNDLTSAQRNADAVALAIKEIGG